MVRWATSMVVLNYLMMVPAMAGKEGVMSMSYPADFSMASVITECINASMPQSV